MEVQDKPQAELALDHMPALEAEMRALFEARWRHWHRAGSYEVAVQDPVTASLLALTVTRMRSHQLHERRTRRK